MYRYKKAGKQKLKNAALIFVIMVLTSIVSIMLYKIYEGIEINTYQTQGYEAEKTIKSIEEKKQQGKEVIDLIEEVTSSVVGISKIKNLGRYNIFKRWNITTWTWNRNNCFGKWLHFIK